MRLRSSLKLVIAAMVVGALSGLYTVETFAQAAAAEKTASAFYMEYQAAFAKAKRIEDLLPYLAAANRKEVESTPAGDRSKMFEMMKMFSASNIKVLKEERTATGATLTAEGIDPMEKKKATGKIEIVREGGAWKVGQEHWGN